MRVSVPTIPRVVSQASSISPAAAVERIASFIASGNVTLLSGAGVSVDSGIRAYRGKDGRYMNPNYKPIFYHELAADNSTGHAFRQAPSHGFSLVAYVSLAKSRQRYWLRSYLGYPPVRDTQPNTTHYALAALQYTGHIRNIVTQNVDGLHHKAIAHLWDDRDINKRILELHGTLHRVHCQFGHIVSRDAFQDRLSVSNPKWKAFVDDLEATGKKLRTNPDGDVELEGASYGDFVVPECPECLAQGRRNTNQKPDLILFGESIPQTVKERSFRDIEQADKLFLVGTTLATFSAYRLVKCALQLKKPVLLLNVGPTRADELEGIDKIEIATSLVMRDAVHSVLGSRADVDPIIADLLNKGVHKPPLNDDNDG